MTVGDRIKKCRLQNHMTLDELASKASTTKQTIHKYENGIITNIPSSRILAISKALNTTPDYLMGWDSSSKEEDKLNQKLYKLIDSLSEEQLQQAIDFIIFLKSKEN